MLTRVSHGLGLSEHELRQMAVRRAKERRGGVTGGAKMASESAVQRTPVSSALAKKDSQVLELAIRFPEYILKLGEAGVLDALSTDRAKIFWRLLEQYGQEALVYLDERQKSFWGRVLTLDAGDGRGAQDEAEARWLHVVHHIIEPARVNRRGQELTEAIRQAYERGDQAEVARLSKSLSDLVGEKSE
jgi:DNA primase